MEQATTALQAYMEIRRLYDDARTPQEIQAAKERQHEIQRGLSPEDNDALNKAAIDDAHAEMDKMDNWIAQAEDEKMRKTLASLTDAVSMGYIAKTYFGKSRSWLLQRINGNKVNGETVRFSRDERAQFQNALHDLGRRLSAVAL